MYYNVYVCMETKKKEKLFRGTQIDVLAED